MSIKKGGITLLVALSLSGISVARADTKSEIDELKSRLNQLELKLETETNTLDKKTNTIADELQKSKLNQFIPEKAELKSEWGLGPAASSVYAVPKGISLGGYGEANYRNFVGDVGSKKDQSDLLRLITYLGYKFNDSILFNSEIEFEHANTEAIGGDSGDEEGEVEVEFAYLDFLINEAVNARAGLVLIPMGFINELHEPNTFHGVRRPEVEQVIIPSTWRELGVGIFGETELNGKLEYRSYIVNGLRASRFSDNGIRSGRQSGNRALTEDIAWTGRADYSPEIAPGLLLGGSFWFGNSGQDEVLAESTPSVLTSILESHMQYRRHGAEFRALGAWGWIDDAELLSTALETTVADRFYGWYTELAYDILPLIAGDTGHYLAPFVRYEDFDTQAGVPSSFAANEGKDKRLYVAGISYKPISNVVLKLDYRNFDTEGAPTADEVALGMGFAF